MSDEPPAPKTPPPLVGQLVASLGRLRKRMGVAPPEPPAPPESPFVGDLPVRFRSLVAGAITLAKPVSVAFRRLLAEELGKPPGQGRGLYLWGPPGVGKTVAACRLVYLVRNASMVKRAAWRDAYEAAPGNPVAPPPPRRTVAYTADRDFILEARDAMSWNRTQGGRLERMVRSSLLVLDDLASGTDATPYTDFEAGTLGDLVDRSYREGQVLVVTSNKHLDALAGILGERIPSRIREMCDVLHLEGRDRRRR